MFSGNGYQPKPHGYQPKMPSLPWNLWFFCRHDLFPWCCVLCCVYPAILAHVLLLGKSHFQNLTLKNLCIHTLSARRCFGAESSNRWGWCWKRGRKRLGSSQFSVLCGGSEVSKLSKKPVHIFKGLIFNLCGATSMQIFVLFSQGPKSTVIHGARSSCSLPDVQQLLLLLLLLLLHY